MNDHTKVTLDQILRVARQYNASDLHLIEGLPPAYRVGGDIILASNCDPLTREDLGGLAAEFLNEEQRARLEREREMCISYRHPECGRIRLSLYHRLGAVEMAIRMCNLEVKTSADLGLPEMVDKLAQLTSGLIIITGPTGTGKTTTMNYIIDSINSSRRAKIITIEDPVEFEHQHRRSLITQIEVGTDTRDFAHCLRHILRLDPNVIAIGEMRDLETMETALAAAETGHLVLATLHTPGTVGTVERIVSSFDGPRQPQVVMQLSSTLQGVVAQRLIPTVDKKRRVLATEVLVATSAVRTTIRDGKLHQLYNVMITARSAGMHSMEDSLAELYRRGEITLDNAYAAALVPEQLKRLLKD